MVAPSNSLLLKLKLLYEFAYNLFKKVILQIVTTSPFHFVIRKHTGWEKPTKLTEAESTLSSRIIQYTLMTAADIFPFHEQSEDFEIYSKCFSLSWRVNSSSESKLIPHCSHLYCFFSSDDIELSYSLKYNTIGHFARNVLIGASAFFEYLNVLVPL